MRMPPCLSDKKQAIVQKYVTLQMCLIFSPVWYIVTVLIYIIRPTLGVLTMK